MAIYKKLIIVLVLCTLWLFYACSEPNGELHSEVNQLPINEVKVLRTNQFSLLPIAISNNAVASVEFDGEIQFYSFMGLESGKDWSDVSKKVFRYANQEWKQLSDVPVPQGRLASIAATVNKQVYLFGGYTVAENHEEVSTPEVLRFNPLNETYTRVSDIPIPTDDAVALVYQDRYIYLVSGWHDKGNINLVQVYDVVEDAWKQATQFPGAAVFGHAGGIVANNMIICDGVKINYPPLSKGDAAKREFVMSNECYKGRIDEKDPYRIHWSSLPTHSGKPRYRMAAVGDVRGHQVIFLGGSDNPYNYNGIGYNGVPAKPVNKVFAFDFVTQVWTNLGNIQNPTMDHRGLLETNNGFVVVGGMDSKQEVLSRVYEIELNAL